MSLKTVWDYAYYWGVLGVLFFNQAMLDTELLSDRRESLASIQAVHKNLQQLFHDHAAEEPVIGATGDFTDHARIPLLCRLNSELADRLTPHETGMRLDANIECLHQLAQDIVASLGGCQSESGLDGTSVQMGSLIA